MNPPDIHQMTTQDILLIIGAITTMACSIIAAFKTTTTGRKVDGTKLHLEQQDQKLDNIHNQTNGNLASIQAQLEVARREVAELKAAAAAKAEAAAELAAERNRHQPVMISDRRVRRGTKDRS